jgi:hypothetical protein
MNRADIFSSTARPQGVMSAVKDFWAEYPDRFARALRPPARRSAAEEVYGYLALDRSPRTGNPRTSSAGAATSSARTAQHSPVVRAGDFSQQRSAPQAPWRASAGAVGPQPVSMSGGGFIDPAQQARAHVSPLGGKVW